MVALRLPGPSSSSPPAARRAPALLACGALTLAFAACSSPSEPTPTTPVATTASGGAAPVAPPRADAGAPAARPMPGGVATRVPFRVGTVTVSQVDAPGGGAVQTRTVVTANFAVAPGGTCEIRQDGACRVTRCDPAPQGETPHSATAGTIHVTGGAGSITLAPQSGAQYDPLVNEGARFGPGASVRVNATGGTVPAFDAAVRFPTPIAVDSSWLATERDPTHMALVVDRGTNLRAHWRPQAGALGDVELAITQAYQPEGIAIEVLCRFPENAGAGVMPAAMLGVLQPTTGTDAPDSTVVTLAASSRSEVVLGDHHVVVLAQTSTVRYSPQVR